MFLELRHLRSLLYIDEHGSLARAADHLHLTQSAISHQIKAMERYFGVPLFQRRHKPLQFTPAGRRLVALARELLPAVEAAERDLRQLAGGRAGRLNITIECHACFEWLLPVLATFRENWPEVDVDIRLGASFEPIPALIGGEIDLVITSDPVDSPDVAYEPLFGYQGLLVAAPDHPLADKGWIEPSDLADQTLITYPVERERLDVFRLFLTPAGREPAAVRQVELTALILQLVASRRGVAVLPDWVLRESTEQGALVTRPLGRQGLHGTLYAALRSRDREIAYLQEFITLARRRGG